jgi:hypothetical protein
MCAATITRHDDCTPYTLDSLMGDKTYMAYVCGKQECKARLETRATMRGPEPTVRLT